MFKYKKETCDSEFKNWREIKRSFLDRFTSVKICSQPEVMMQAKLVSCACVAGLSDLLKENAENSERKMQGSTKQDKLLKSWRFKFRGMMETIKRTYEDAVRVLEILKAVLEGLQFDLMSFEASKENVFWTLASGYMVADKLQNFCTEMWLMDNVRWRYDKQFSDDIAYGVKLDEVCGRQGKIMCDSLEVDFLCFLGDKFWPIQQEVHEGVFIVQRAWFCVDRVTPSSGVWHRWMNKIEIWSCVVLLLKRWFSTWEPLLLCGYISGVLLQQDNALEVDCVVLGAGVFEVATGHQQCLSDGELCDDNFAYVLTLVIVLL
ncbi:hypothetical protein Bca4012_036942 [Brassica carinata]